MKKKMVTQFCQKGWIRPESQGLYTNLIRQEPGMGDEDCAISS